MIKFYRHIQNFYFLGCEIKRCPLMQKRKSYFEAQESQSFSQCITAVGKGFRESWGTYNTNRKDAISNLKKKCDNWHLLAQENVKLAWHSRKLRLLIFNLQDLSNVVKFELASYSGKEINWMRKIMRSLKKSIETQKKTYHRFASTFKNDFKGTRFILYRKRKDYYIFYFQIRKLNILPRKNLKIHC